MAIAPVMNCKVLSLQEKILLTSIMSMKHSLNSVYATKDKIMSMTGLSSDEFDDALDAITTRGLATLRGKEWRIIPRTINEVLQVDVYDLAQLERSRETTVAYLN